MNHSSLLSPVKLGSLALTKNQPPAIDPFIFMDRKEPEIHHRLTREYEYSENEAAEFFLSLKGILKKLKNLRRYKIKTFDYLDETIKNLPVKIRLFTILFLLKPLYSNRAWVHASNCLAQMANRDLLFPLELEFIPEYELIAMIEEDEEDPLIFNESVLERFHGVFNDGFLWEKKISIETFKNWFRVNPVGKPVIKEEMITYFCYALWQINNYRLIEICPNIEDWYSALTGKKTKLSKLKGQAVGPNKTEVDRRIEHITSFHIG